MRALRSAIPVLLLLLPLAAGSASATPPTPEQADFEEAVRANKPMPPKPSSKKMYDFSDAKIDGELGTAAMRRANRAAAAIVQRRMEANRADDLAMLRRAARADVLVVSGSYDRVQDVLAAMGVDHVVIPPHLLSLLPLLATQTLMVNCAGSVPPEAIQRVRQYVQRGGYLVTTDWALAFLTQRAFPGFVEYNGIQTKNDVVPVHLHVTNEPLLEHVKLVDDHPRWWLEGASYPIRVKDRRRVRILMSSPEMKRKYGEGAVVVAFPYGDGQVLHMTSHFYLQQSKLVAGSEKAKGSSFAKKAGLSQEQIAQLRKQGVDVDKVAAGDLNSAFAMQQLITNLLVSKQKVNETLVAKYGGRVVVDAAKLAGKPDAEPPKTAGSVKRGYKVQVLERRGGKVKVRDMFGREGWLESAAVK